MKIMVLAALAALAAAPAALAQSVHEHGASGADAKTPAHAPAAAMPGPLHGEGRVVSLQPAQGRITISHDPIPALKWPAMTMAFSATPELQAALKEGQRVTFCFAPEGTSYRISMVTGH